MMHLAVCVVVCVSCSTMAQDGRFNPPFTRAELKAMIDHLPGVSPGQLAIVDTILDQHETVFETEADQFRTRYDEAMQRARDLRTAAPDLPGAALGVQAGLVQVAHEWDRRREALYADLTTDLGAVLTAEQIEAWHRQVARLRNLEFARDLAVYGPRRPLVVLSEFEIPSASDELAHLLADYGDWLARMRAEFAAAHRAHINDIASAASRKVGEDLQEAYWQSRRRVDALVVRIYRENVQFEDRIAAAIPNADDQRRLRNAVWHAAFPHLHQGPSPVEMLCERLEELGVPWMDEVHAAYEGYIARRFPLRKRLISAMYDKQLGEDEEERIDSDTRIVEVLDALFSLEISTMRSLRRLTANADDLPADVQFLLDCLDET